MRLAALSSPEGMPPASSALLFITAKMGHNVELAAAMPAVGVLQLGLLLLEVCYFCIVKHKEMGYSIAAASCMLQPISPFFAKQ